jgi:hypothetical protein
MRFYVQFDGAGFVWTHDDAESWFPITSEHFPGFDQIFDALAPSDVRGLAPPFLSTLPQPGFLQIWTGILIRTLPGWSVLVRHPANLPHSRDYEMYEGIVETDRWFYPLFVNVRVTACDRPIRFDPATPLLQVQPLNRATYSESTLRSAVFLDGLESLGDEDWHDYRRILGTRAEDPGMRPGRYAGAVRRRASVGESCTFHSMIEAD